MLQDSKLLTFLNGVWGGASSVGIFGCMVSDECRYIISWHQHRDPFWVHTYLQIDNNHIKLKVSFQSNKKLISNQLRTYVPLRADIKPNYLGRKDLTLSKTLLFSFIKTKKIFNYVGQMKLSYMYRSWC